MAVPIFMLQDIAGSFQEEDQASLTPDYSSYSEPAIPAVWKNNSSSLRVPYYFNLAPDRDLLVALTAMSSRGVFISEGKYRQLIAPKISPDHQDSIWSIESKISVQKIKLLI